MNHEEALQFFGTSYRPGLVRHCSQGNRPLHGQKCGREGYEWTSTGITCMVYVYVVIEYFSWNFVIGGILLNNTQRYMYFEKSDTRKHRQVHWRPSTTLWDFSCDGIRKLWSEVLHWQSTDGIGRSRSSEFVIHCYYMPVFNSFCKICLKKYNSDP